MREDYPVHRELLFQALEVCELKTSPAGFRSYFFQPPRSEARNPGGHASVFFVIGKHASFGQCAEPVIILARQSHVMRIQREERIHWGVLPNPGKGLQPRILRNSAGKFKMRRRWIQLPLRVKHACADRHKEKEPTINPPVKHVLPQQSTYDQKEKQIDQV